MTKTTRVQMNGSEYDFDAVVNMMDDEIREELSDRFIFSDEPIPVDPQTFTDAYCEMHQAKYGERFEI